MSGQAIPVLGDADLRALDLDPVRIADAIEAAVRREADGLVWTSPKASLYTGDGRYMMTTLSGSDTPPVSVVKFVMVSPDNPQAGLPSINGSIMLHDSRTGQLRAVLDANWITEVRTAGLSAVVARKMANPASTRMAFVGAGAQARSHLDAFAALFPLREVAIFGRGRANTDRLAERAARKGLQVAICENAEAALEGADLVMSSVPLTSDAEPFLNAGWLKPGAFASIIDIAVPWRTETLGAFDRIIIDNLQQEAASAKKLVPADLVTGDVNGLVTGKIATDRDPAARTAFVFRGIAIGDFAIAALAWQAALGDGGADR